MHSTLRTTLVVPCYNEGNRLDLPQFRAFLSASERVDLVFVNDGSTDTTVEVLQELCRGFEHCTTVLSYGGNKGKAEAVRYGMNHALSRPGTDVVGFWDADLATPLDSLWDFLAVLNERPEINMVFGARVKLLGREVMRLPVRHYLGRVFATVVSKLLGIAIYDTQCGAKVFRTSAQLRDVLARPFLSKWVFDVEILARFLALHSEQRHKVAEVIYEYPLTRWIDVAGSKVRPKHFFVACFDILRITHQIPANSVRPTLTEYVSSRSQDA